MLEKDIPSVLAKELSVTPKQIEDTVALLDEGNTVPFIARYRKEATGGLTDEQLRVLSERLSYLRNFVKRQEEILTKIQELGKLTPELQKAIEKAVKLQELEDLYLPYKQKKRTRAMMAKERGLEPLAEMLLAQAAAQGTALEAAAAFVNEEKEVPTAEDALAGAKDIVAEQVAEDAALRQELRNHLWNTALLATEPNPKADPAEAKTFQMYAEFSEPVRTLPSHRVLAINRGEKKDCLKVSLITAHEANVRRLEKKLVSRSRRSPFDEALHEAIEDGYKRLLLPSLERDIRSTLTEQAEEQAIKLFGVNLKQLLLQAPLSGHTVLGLDPGFRNGCKCAVVDRTGRILDHGIIQVTQSEGAKAKAAQTVLSWIKKYGVDLISIGNGTASYETEQFAAKLIADNKLANVNYLITNEAGASVYSASKLAAQELPEYGVEVRGAASIARRVQDPLAELVKIDPQAIGVGQYQHDVNQKQLQVTLDATVEDAVNHVGVDLNTASPALLSHIAGISAAVAKNIVTYRNENGSFKTRRELLKVPRLGPAAFTQCAGFLRLAPKTAKNPLDSTSVHPESYELAEKLLAELDFSLEDLLDKEKLGFLSAKVKLADVKKLAAKLSAGEPTVKDILTALTRPGRDPREDLPAPLTRQAIVKLSDLKVGTIMRGTVRNITDFGAFVDIGLHEAGLIHISELSRRRVKHPLEVLSVGDTIDTVIIKVDEERGRIGLSLKQVEDYRKKASQGAK